MVYFDMVYPKIRHFKTNFLILRAQRFLILENHFSMFRHKDLHESFT